MAKIFQRKLKSLLIKEIEKPGIVLVFGMRQVGKTTLLTDIFGGLKAENKIFLDIENPLNQKIFEEQNYDNILSNMKPLGLNQTHRMFIFIDEIQVAPEIVKPVKYLYDHYKIKFFLTGSSSFYLKNLFPESLAGRKIIYELYPLDFTEFLIFKERKKRFSDSFLQKAKNKNKIAFETYSKLYDEYLNFGGFPAVVIEEDTERKKMILADIFKSYFEKDVKVLGDFKNINNFRDIILLLAGRTGSKLDISKIASEIGVSRETVYSYLNFLEKTYFVSFVSPFSKNINGEVRCAKKVYFCDTGMLNYLGKIPDGTLFENAVFNTLKKVDTINYYQRYRGAEIDFILNKKIAFEAKMKSSDIDIKRLKRIVSKLGLNEFYIVSKYFDKNTNVISAQDL
ncbi:MAG: ATP-binding protein [Elusimicrobiota bacterium]